MKKENYFIIFTIVLIHSFNLFAFEYNIKTIVSETIDRDLKAGSIVTFIGYEYGSGKFEDEFHLKFKQGDKYITTHQENVKYLDFQPKNTKEFWIAKALKQNVYFSFLEEGLNNSLRKSLAQEAEKYDKYFKKNDMIYEDSFLESYIYGLVHKVYPDKIEDGRKAYLKIAILKDLNPNVYIFSNGFIYITTGLISLLDSEQELIAVIAQSIAHYALDHSIFNIIEKQNSIDWSMFWANLASSIVYEIEKKNNDQLGTNGMLTYYAGALTYDIANSIIERMGFTFSQQQEFIADDCSIELLNFLNTDRRALVTALEKINSYYKAKSNIYNNNFLDVRIKRLGKSFLMKDLDFRRTFSKINTLNALIEFNQHNLDYAEKMIMKNIESNIAEELDFSILAMIYLYKYNDVQKNSEALGFIQKAKTLGVNPFVQLSKYEAIILFRLKRYSDAIICLNSYKDGILSQSIFSQIMIDKEIEWINSMVYKAQVFKNSSN